MSLEASQAAFAWVPPLPASCTSLPSDSPAFGYGQNDTQRQHSFCLKGVTHCKGQKVMWWTLAFQVCSPWFTLACSLKAYPVAYSTWDGWHLFDVQPRRSVLTAALHFWPIGVNGSQTFLQKKRKVAHQGKGYCQWSNCLGWWVASYFALLNSMRVARN